MNCSATKKELADRFHVCTRTIERMCRAGRLSYFKVGKAIRFDAEAARAEFQRAGYKAS